MHMYLYVRALQAMAAGPLIALINYFALSYSQYWQLTIDQSSVDIFFTCVIIFGLLLPVSNFVVVWRLGLAKHRLARMLAIEIRYSLFMSLLFTGLSYHVLSALVHHAFSISLSWSTTTKEGQRTTRWREIRKTFSHLRVMYVGGLLLLIMMACMYALPPKRWQIRRYAAVLPLLHMIVSHMLCPLLLNPVIMLGAKAQGAALPPPPAGAAAIA